MSKLRQKLWRAGAVAGFDAAVHRPGAVVRTAEGKLISGQVKQIERDWAGACEQIFDLPNALLLPGMVNAHSHLELTAIGPQPYGGDFIGWVKMLREQWPGEGEAFSKLRDLAWLTSAASRGASMSLASGVEAVGDIASDPAVADARREAGLAGISFDELFGLGPPWDQEALDRIAATTTEGLQPHAPYSAGPSILKAAVSTGLPLSTHLAETRDELQFISQGTGPFLDFLKRLGKWSPDFADDYGHGLSPVQWMQPYLKQAQWLVAHCNYVSDDDIQILADAGTSVAYCPVASDYFGHRNHRYRELLEAGVNVCLGTDSIVCQPATARQPLSILDQMRHLYRRDMTSPQLLLEMATANGRGALGLQDENRLLSAVVFEPADSTDPLIQVLKSDRPVSVIVLENSRPMLGESK